jgi:hypothetical protein
LLLSLIDNFKDNATKHLVLEAMISSARNEDHYQMLVKWFKEGFVFDKKGAKLENV